MPTTAPTSTPQISHDYPFNLFDSSSQTYKNPIKRCNKTCEVCKTMNTKFFAHSTTRSIKIPINPPPPNSHYNCQTTNVVYLITCKETNCGAQYVGYTMRKIKQRLNEHKTNLYSQVQKHCHEHKHWRKLETQILTQAPRNEPNIELWLKQQEYFWICKLGTLTKLNPKGLNKLIYDPTIRTR